MKQRQSEDKIEKWKFSVMRMLDIQAVADILSISRRKAEQMLACGELPQPIRFGRLRRWHPDSIKQWLASRAGLDGTAQTRGETPNKTPAKPGRPRTVDDFKY